jgi:hypothetical protein
VRYEKREALPWLSGEIREMKEFKGKRKYMGKIGYLL